MCCVIYVFNKALKNKHTARLWLANSILIIFKPSLSDTMVDRHNTRRSKDNMTLAVVLYIGQLGELCSHFYLETLQHEQNKECFWLPACDLSGSDRTSDCDSFCQRVIFPTIFLISLTRSWIPRLAHKCAPERKKKIGFNQEIWKPIPQIIKAHEVSVRPSTPDDGETWWISNTWQSKVCSDVS